MPSFLLAAATGKSYYTESRRQYRIILFSKLHSYIDSRGILKTSAVLFLILEHLLNVQVVSKSHLNAETIRFLVEAGRQRFAKTAQPKTFTDLTHITWTVGIYHISLWISQKTKAKAVSHSSAMPDLFEYILCPYHCGCVLRSVDMSRSELDDLIPASTAPRTFFFCFCIHNYSFPKAGVFLGLNHFRSIVNLFVFLTMACMPCFT